MEFDDLGSRCTFCNKQDFLPLECLFCTKEFCKEHINQKKHECIPILKRKKKRKKNDKKKKNIEKCNNNKCKEKMILINCQFCNNKVCIQHRYQNLHDCNFKENNISKNKKKESNVHSDTKLFSCFKFFSC